MKRQRHGKRHTRLYRIWSNIKTRCYNAHDPHYDRYGGRGIDMCDEWLNNFEAFYNWAMDNGYSDSLTIDRIDNNAGYSPNNCRWATVKEQNHNKRNIILITYKGKTLTPNEWARELGTGHDTIRQRYHKGWSTEEVLYGRKRGDEDHERGII